MSSMVHRREFVAALLALPWLAQGDRVRILVLGIAQDGGFPQVGTYNERNDLARRDPSLARKVSSLAILNEGARRCYLVDATPDLPAQLEMLRRSTFVAQRPSRDLIDGVLLTHAHVGHYTGLMFLGLEAMDARGVPVHCTSRMQRFLANNGPWDLLIRRKEIEPRVFEAGKAVQLDEQVQFRAIAVPHRDEYTDTVGFVIQGPRKRLFYLPDVDYWTEELTETVRGVDLAMIDGSFFDDHEMPGVDMSRFPHPRILQTMETLREVSTAVYFIHLNNSNPALNPASPERRRILEAGFHLADEGMELEI